MKLKELKEIISGAEKTIDRIASFCDNYEQMFDHAAVLVRDSTVMISMPTDYEPETGYSTLDGIQCIPAAEAIAALLAMPGENDDFDVQFEGLDNENEPCLFIRKVVSAKFYDSGKGTTGLSLMGRESLPYHDDGLFLTRIIIEDERASNLNESFYDFIETATGWHDGEFNGFGDNFTTQTTRQGKTFISFISEEQESNVVTGLLAGIFRGVYFLRIPLTTSDRAECVTNDRECSKYHAIIYPAFIRDSILISPPKEYEEIAEVPCYKMECDSEEEMEQFISSHNPDPTVGDVVQCITTHYINDPMDFILES